MGRMDRYVLPLEKGLDPRIDPAIRVPVYMHLLRTSPTKKPVQHVLPVLAPTVILPGHRLRGRQII
jgi:hypothetical protein